MRSVWRSLRVTSPSTSAGTSRSGPISKPTLLAYGVRTYSIFLDSATSTLFAYVEFDSVERWEAVAQTDVCRRWWAHMRELMPSNPDNSPITTPLDEVFHIEQR